METSWEASGRKSGMPSAPFRNHSRIVLLIFQHFYKDRRATQPKPQMQHPFVLVTVRNSRACGVGRRVSGKLPRPDLGL